VITRTHPRVGGGVAGAIVTGGRTWCDTHRVYKPVASPRTGRVATATKSTIYPPERRINKKPVALARIPRQRAPRFFFFVFIQHVDRRERLHGGTAPAAADPSTVKAGTSADQGVPSRAAISASVWLEARGGDHPVVQGTTRWPAIADDIVCRCRASRCALGAGQRRRHRRLNPQLVAQASSPQRREDQLHVQPGGNEAWMNRCAYIGPEAR